MSLKKRIENIQKLNNELTAELTLLNKYKESPSKNKVNKQFTAKDARKLSENASTEEKVQELLDKIKVEAKAGKYYAHFPTLSEEQTDLLKNLGFKLYFSHVHGCWEVYWTK